MTIDRIKVIFLNETPQRAPSLHENSVEGGFCWRMETNECHCHLRNAHKCNLTHTNNLYLNPIILITPALFGLLFAITMATIVFESTFILSVMLIEIMYSCRATQFSYTVIVLFFSSAFYRCTKIFQWKLQLIFFNLILLFHLIGYEFIKKMYLIHWKTNIISLNFRPFAKFYAFF